MNLKSCNNCGVVLDLSKMNFPRVMPEDNSQGAIEWQGSHYCPVLPCPVCKEDVVNEEIKL